MPQMVTNSQSNGTVTSGSVNAGFFGADPTGGIGASISVSETTTVSYATPTMESQDQSTDDHVLNKLFVTHPYVDGSNGFDDPSRNPGRFSFGTSIAEVFEVPDDKHGIRDKKTTMRAFEISISATTPITHSTPEIFGGIPILKNSQNGIIARVDGATVVCFLLESSPCTFIVCYASTLLLVQTTMGLTRLFPFLGFQDGTRTPGDHYIISSG